MVGTNSELWVTQIINKKIKGQERKKIGWWDWSSNIFSLGFLSRLLPSHVTVTEGGLASCMHPNYHRLYISFTTAIFPQPVTN